MDDREVIDIVVGLVQEHVPVERWPQVAQEMKRVLPGASWVYTPRTFSAVPYRNGTRLQSM